MQPRANIIPLAELHKSAPIDRFLTTPNPEVTYTRQKITNNLTNNI